MTTQTQPETMDSIISRTTSILLDIEADMGAEHVYAETSGDKSVAEDAEASMDSAMNSLTSLLREACGQAETVVASVQDGLGLGEGLYTEEERAEIGRSAASILAHLRVLTRALTETDEPTGFAEVMAEIDALAR